MSNSNKKTVPSLYLKSSAFYTLEEFDEYSTKLSKNINSVPLNAIRQCMAKNDGYSSYQAIKEAYNDAGRLGISYVFKDSFYDFSMLDILKNEKELDSFLDKCKQTEKYKNEVEKYDLAISESISKDGLGLSMTPLEFSKSTSFTGEPIIKNGFFDKSVAREVFRMQLTERSNGFFEGYDYYKLLNTLLFSMIKKTDPKADLKDIFIKIASRHWTHQTYFVGLVNYAFEIGAFRPEETLWVKKIDRVMHYSIVSAYRKSSHCESAGVKDLYNSEVENRTAGLIFYDFDDCVRGLKESVKEKLSLKEKIIGMI